MRLTTISVTILVKVASTVAIISLDQKTNGTMIPLTKRSAAWLKLDNGLDFEALDCHVESVDAKMLRGLEIYKRNTGMPHPLAAKGTEVPNLKKRTVGSTTLTGYEKLVWYATITIGTPPKSFTVAIDTGSSDLFLPGPTCSSCLEHTRWDPTSSLTAKAKGSTFNIGFNDGASASGEQYVDNVTIASTSADIQTIGAAKIYAAEMGFPPDGTLGMAFQTISTYPASPVFKTLVAEGKVTEPVFSVKLTIDGGELYLGGMNGDLYDGEIIYTPVTVVGFWQVNIEKIGGNHQTVLSDITAIVDTGANMIFGDRSQVASLHSTLGGKSVGRGYYSFPCNKFPTISFDFGSGTIEVPASTLNMGPVRPGSPDCFSGLAGRDKRAYWSLGAVFLQSVYTVFDFGNQQVGFAKLKLV